MDNKEFHFHKFYNFTILKQNQNVLKDCKRNIDELNKFKFENTIDDKTKVQLLKDLIKQSQTWELINIEHSSDPIIDTKNGLVPTTISQALEILTNLKRITKSKHDLLKLLKKYNYAWPNYTIMVNELYLVKNETDDPSSTQEVEKPVTPIPPIPPIEKGSESSTLPLIPEPMPSIPPESLANNHFILEDDQKHKKGRRIYASLHILNKDNTVRNVYNMKKRELRIGRYVN